VVRTSTLGPAGGSPIPTGEPLRPVHPARVAAGTASREMFGDGRKLPCGRTARPPPTDSVWSCQTARSRPPRPSQQPCRGRAQQPADPVERTITVPPSLHRTGPAADLIHRAWCPAGSRVCSADHDRRNGSAPLALADTGGGGGEKLGDGLALADKTGCTASTPDLRPGQDGREGQVLSASRSPRAE
jgi:hypothetical protein